MLATGTTKPCVASSVSSKTATSRSRRRTLSRGEHSASCSDRSDHALRHAGRRCRSEHSTAYAAYATILATFTGSLGAAAALEQRLRRDGAPPSALDYVVLCAGSFKAARTLSRERVGSVIRQPFVEAERDGGLAVERPAGEGLRRAVGELVTCTRCVGTWAAAGLLTSQVVAPRFGRLLTWSLAAGAANDFLQAGFAALVAREHPDET